MLIWYSGKKKAPKHLSPLPLLCLLHWVPITDHITYKLDCFCNKCLSHSALHYLSFCLTIQHTLFHIWYPPVPHPLHNTLLCLPAHLHQVPVLGTLYPYPSARLPRTSFESWLKTTLFKWLSAIQLICTLILFDRIGTRYKYKYPKFIKSLLICDKSISINLVHISNHL